MKKSVWVSLLFVSAAIHAEPPAPLVMVSGDIKLLRFDWSPLQATDRFELWYQASESAAWRMITTRPGSATYAMISMSSHLFDWRQTRFRLDACDSSGCTPSNPIAVDQLFRHAVGYFKSSSEGLNFGAAVELSADGRTLAVANQENGRAVYLYRRIGSRWVFESRLGPESPNASDTNAGRTMALSGDGNQLAVGSQWEWDPTHTFYSGAVHIYRRVSGTWLLDQTLTLADTTQSSSLGQLVDMDDAGEVIAATAWDVANTRLGQVRIYRRAGTSWTLEGILPVDPVVAECSNIALSGDGSRLARFCSRYIFGATDNRSFVETYGGPGWASSGRIPLANKYLFRGGVALNLDGTLLATTHDEGVSSVWRLTAAGWQSDNPRGSPAFIPAADFSLSMSRNGAYVAIGNRFDDTGGLGIIFPPYIPGQNQSGIVRIFERRGGAWTLRQALKSNTTTAQYFGHSVALGDNASVLAVGAPYDSSAATGINGNPFDVSAPYRGAVWLY
jgi:trimeric autotransporter adhesin